MDLLLIKTEIQISIIDINGQVFNPQLGPLSLFRLRNKEHYNAKGHPFVGDAINKKLKADGIIQ